MPLTRTSRGVRHAGVTVVVFALLLTVAAIWCAQAIGKAERRSGNDLVGYLEASRALYAGADPYHLPDRFPYIYPLFLAAVIRPLAAVPLPLATIVWFAFQSACLWYVLRTAGSHAGVHDADRAAAAAAIVAVFGDVLQNEFLNGQVNLIVLALSVAAIHLTDRKPHVASALLGAAIAVKLTPALLLLYWLIERRYRSIGESVLWAGVLIVSPWLVVQDRLWPLYGSYVRDFILRASSADPQARPIFFRLYGFWGWLTGAAPGRVAIVSASVAVASALALWHWRIQRRPAPAASDPEWLPRSRSDAWVYAAATPLLSPMSEVHHLTFLIPAALVATAAILKRVFGPVVVAGTALFVVLIWIARFQRTGPWYFFAILSLIATACVALQRRRRATG